MSKKANRNVATKPWPENCLWPEPLWDGNGDFWEAEDADMLSGDEDLEELLDIKEYMDGLVEEGRLLPDYSLDPDYEEEDDEDRDDGFERDESDDSFIPEKGLDYWDDGFDIEGWEEDLTSHLNLLKLPLPSPAAEIRDIIGYEFVNENLLRQAFTRRAFGLEYGVGDSEQLEFFGDSVLNLCVTQEISRQLTDVITINTDGPFRAVRDEGELSKIREHFVCREYLSERAELLGLDQYILYGSGEEPSESAREDMMEALIGAVAADSGWDWRILEDVVDRLVEVQLMRPDEFLKATHFDLFNSWHQKHFGRMPEYEITRMTGKKPGENRYNCSLRYSVPENDQGVWTAQRIDVEEETRSKAREMAADQAYRFVMNHGLWIRLADAGIEPRLEDAINQLQELYQKKYVEAPVYEFHDKETEPFLENDEWYCSCTCSGVHGYGRAIGKTKAKKEAAFMVLVMLMKSAGICEDDWEKEMWETIARSHEAK